MANTTKASPSKNATRTSKTQPTASPKIEAAKVEMVDVVNMVQGQEPEVSKEPAHVYAMEEPIMCRSITAGKLIMRGTKSRNKYVWVDAGDVEEVEYRDLLALRGTRSGFLMKPLFIIEDDRLLSDPRWEPVQKVKMEVYNRSIPEILELPINDFKAAIGSIPSGLIDTLKVEISKGIEDGSFDSLQKIRAFDEIIGTDFASII